MVVNAEHPEASKYCNSVEPHEKVVNAVQPEISNVDRGQLDILMKVRFLRFDKLRFLNIVPQNVSNNKLFDKSVRVNINNRKLTIHQEDGLIKISANNSKKFKDIITQYNFPASMNVKMSIKKEFKIKNLSDVPEEKLNDIINYLKGLQPKEIIQ